MIHRHAAGTAGDDDRSGRFLQFFLDGGLLCLSLLFGPCRRHETLLVQGGIAGRGNCREAVTGRSSRLFGRQQPLATLQFLQALQSLQVASAGQTAESAQTSKATAEAAQSGAAAQQSGAGERQQIGLRDLLLLLLGKRLTELGGGKGPLNVAATSSCQTEQLLELLLLLGQFALLLQLLEQSGLLRSGTSAAESSKLVLLLLLEEQLLLEAHRAAGGGRIEAAEALQLGLQCRRRGRLLRVGPASSSSPTASVAAVGRVHEQAQGGLLLLLLLISTARKRRTRRRRRSVRTVHHVDAFFFRGICFYKERFCVLKVWKHAR
jgi:hypothetical protein